MHIKSALILSAFIVVQAAATSVPAFCRQLPVASEASALDVPPGAVSPGTAAIAPDSPIGPAVAAAPPAAETHAPAAADSPSGFSRFVRDVGGDYRGFFSKGVALRLGIGGTAAASSTCGIRTSRTKPLSRRRPRRSGWTAATSTGVPLASGRSRLAGGRLVTSRGAPKRRPRDEPGSRAD